MNRNKLLVKNTIIYAVGNFGSKFLTFLLLPFYTYYLSTGDYGYFDLITTTVTLLIPIITFQITDGLYRFLLDSKNDNDISRVVSNSFFITLTNLFFFNVIYIIFVQFKSFQYEYLILSQINFNIISAFWAQISRGIRKNAEYSISGIVGTIIVLSLNIIFIIVFHFGVASLILSNIISCIGVIIYLEFRLKICKYIRYSLYDKKLKKELLLFSIPLIPNLVSWWFMNVSDRYFINLYKGIEANGIYAVSNKFPAILIMVNAIFSLAWQESAISEYKSKDRNKFYSNMFNILMIIEFTSVIVLLPLTKFAIKYAVNDKFHEAALYIPFLYVATILNAFSSFYGTGYLSTKDTKGAFYTSSIGGIVNVIFNIILIPVIGIQGASISTMISFFVMWILRIFQTKKYFTIYINKIKLLSLSLISALYIFFYYNNNIMVEIFLLIISFIIFLVYNKNLVSKTIKYLTNKLIFVKKDVV
ncbi:lipopolysaccharide biosynthesis protein [Clostridium pasteurianum]|uniref:Membrane protein involved in the export of O-antigen and teichoic acid n=1 Tax=Clostridium pasteurianum BC1 TaxID=86416 RepID=R4K5Q6_CLOPA|nr:oligosaccharide flippase family protein [Clostridium pasteurianum]AGK95874.1 membrane protein involved in the export of O-antigen and teichoic acid [Clostridium pasteurianum BC1]